MSRGSVVFAAALAAATLLGLRADAASLRVSPVKLEVSAGGSASTLTLTNTAQRPLDVQVRVFRWTQKDGVDVLEQTDRVVASPPVTSVPAGAEYLVRVVRTATTPVHGEESYRLLVDELPGAEQAGANQVKLALRYSIPVFFNETAAETPQVSWRLETRPEGLTLVATNRGQRRLLVSDLMLKNRAGAVVHRRGGLAGYVLAGAEMRWVFKPQGADAPATLSARSDAGPFDVALAPPTEG